MRKKNIPIVKLGGNNSLHFNAEHTIEKVRNNIKIFNKCWIASYCNMQLKVLGIVNNQPGALSHKYTSCDL